MCSLGIEPMTFALLTQCSTTEPQEHTKNLIILLSFFSFYFVKGVIWCDMHFYKLLELKYVLAVCVHNHPND